MGKLVAWIIAIGLVLVVLYAILSGLPADVQAPFTPQPRP